jgi:hypothetical protein
MVIICQRYWLDRSFDKDKTVLSMLSYLSGNVSIGRVNKYVLLKSTYNLVRLEYSSHKLIIPYIVHWARDVRFSALCCGLPRMERCADQRRRILDQNPRVAVNRPPVQCGHGKPRKAAEKNVPPHCLFPREYLCRELYNIELDALPDFPPYSPLVFLWCSL